MDDTPHAMRLYICSLGKHGGRECEAGNGHSARHFGTSTEICLVILRRER